MDAQQVRIGSTGVSRIGGRGQHGRGSRSVGGGVGSGCRNSRSSNVLGHWSSCDILSHRNWGGNWGGNGCGSNIRGSNVVVNRVRIVRCGVRCNDTSRRQRGRHRYHSGRDGAQNAQSKGDLGENPEIASLVDRPRGNRERIRFSREVEQNSMFPLTTILEYILDFGVLVALRLQVNC
uniref:Uncharacterized protein n=1 Tax=Anopheles farauti TaxID=69004 RepID=A0A182QCV4_9DIPT